MTVDAYADPPFGQEFAPDSHWLRFLALLDEYDVKQLGHFQMLLGQPINGEYPDYEALTGMTSQDAASLKLYSFDGVALETGIVEVTSDVDRS